MINNLVQGLCTGIHNRGANNDGKADQETEHWVEPMGNACVGFTARYGCF